MSEKSNNSQSFWGKYKTVIITVSVTLLLVVLILAALAFGMLKYYIDGASINRRAIDAPLRSVLWETPSSLPGRLNHVRNNRDASISSDGRMIILAHEYSENNFDLYVSRCVDDEWSQQIPIDEVNSVGYSEKCPEISDDGRFLFFSSNRPGGFGGYDIWYSYRDGIRWSRPVNMGEHINTALDELDPAISPDGTQFFFSSNRPFSSEDARSGKNDFDLYIATVKKGSIKDLKEVIPKPPPFSNCKNMVFLNSPYDEGKAVLTPRGNTIYFSSNRPGGFGGFDLYRSYLVDGHFNAPINFGLPINSRFDDINPTMSLEGFGIYFSSNRKSRNPNDFLVFKSTSREVLMKFDYALLVKLVITFFGCVLAVLLIYFLLKLLLADSRMSLIWKCLLAAVIVHLIAILLCIFWVFTAHLAKALKPAPKELTINVNNLARESIAMAIRESVSSLPKIQTTSVVEKLPIPTQQPVTSTSTPTQQATVPKTSVTPVSMKVVPDVSGAPPKGEPLPMLKPFQSGATIKMESPPGEVAGIATPTTGKANDGKAKPLKSTPRPKELPKFELDSVPVEMNITQVDNPNIEVVDKNFVGPPSSDKALKQANRVVDSPKGNDPTANEILLAASAAPVPSLPGSLGTLMFDSYFPMEEQLAKKMERSPEITLLLNDPKISRALALTMRKDKVAEKELKKLLESYIAKHSLEFNSFEVVKFLIKEKKLKPVGDLVYDNMGGLSIQVDAELEVPEKYNR